MSAGPDVFLSYRTSDGGLAAAHLADRIGALVGPGQVFRDSDSLLPGRPWPPALVDALGAARVLVAVIGPGWAGALPDGTRRLDDPDDWVRREIATALRRGVPVVPVLLDGAPGLTGLDLPGELAALATLQTATLRHRSLGADTDALLSGLLTLVPGLATHRLFEPPPRRPVFLLPSALLRPEFGVVPFAGRDGETADLLAWSGGAGGPVRTLTGRGGAGKTRLALHLVDRVRERGLLAGFLREDADPGGLAGLSTAALVVVDYAEGRTEQVARLLAVAVDAPVRVLLLARAPGRWQQRLHQHRDEAVAALAADLAPTALTPLAAVDGGAEFRRAVAAFAPHLTPVRPPRPPRLDVSHALDVHAAALAALLDRADPAGGGTTGGPVQRVLAHERRYWRHAAAAHGLDDRHDERFAQTVAAATLCGARDADGARRLLAHLPAFTGAGDAVEPHRRWHVAAYPGPEPLVPLRPDRLGEELVAEVLADAPELPAAVAHLLDVPALARALTVLSRAAGRHPHLAAAMAALLRADPGTAAPVAVAVATADAFGDDAVGGDALVRALAEVSAAEPGLDLLAHLPDRSLALTGLAVVATRAALRREERRPDPDPAARAHLTHDLAVRLGAAGEAEEALVRASDAVALLRQLGDPDDLAMGLDTLATALRELGQFADALDRSEEALAVLPEGASALRVALLSSRGNLLGDVGRHHDAVAVLDEAARTSRALATGDPDDDADRLGTVLQNLAVALVDVDRLDDALRAATEAVELRAELDAHRPDRYRDDHVLALITLGAVHAERREHPAAAAVAEEAAALARTLVQRHGPRHVGRLADALNNSATALRRVGEPERAVERLTEAVEAYRDLADARPATELASLAAALHNLGNALDDLGRVSAALDRHDEAVEIFRKLAGPDGGPDLDLELADALRARVGPRLDAGAVADAVDDATEAVALIRRHVHTRGRTARRRLAGALHELARATGDPEPAVEAVGLLREAAATDDPDAAGDLAAALHGLAQHLDEAGRPAEAVVAFVELRDRLTDPDLRSSVLHDEAVCRSALGEHAVALELVTGAVALRRELLDGSVGRRLELAESLNNLADTLHDLGRDPDAVAPATEAVGLCAQVAREIGPGNARMHVICLLTLAGVTTGAARADAVRRARVLAGGDEELCDLVDGLAETPADETDA